MSPPNDLNNAMRTLVELPGSIFDDERFKIHCWGSLSIKRFRMPQQSAIKIFQQQVKVVAAAVLGLSCHVLTLLNRMRCPLDSHGHFESPVP